MRKLRTQTGETLVETMVALLIALLCLSFLALSLITAGRVNAGVREKDTAVRYDDVSAGEAAQVTISTGRGTGGTSYQVPVIKHVTDNGYCYYSCDGT